MGTRALAALLAALLAACGQPLLYAELDAPSVAVTQALPALPGAPPIDAPATALPPGGMDLPLGGIDLGAEGEHSRITLNGATLQLLHPSAGTSFAGVRTAELQLLPAAGSNQAAVVIASYDRARDGAAADRLVLRAAAEVDLLPYLSAQQVRVQVLVAGVPPGPLGSTWSSDLTVDLHVLARVEVR